MIDELLETRGKRYGDYEQVARTSQALKQVFRNSPNWETMEPYMRESLDMTANKMARILCGDPTYVDNLDDIMGYTQLYKNAVLKKGLLVNPE